MNILELEDRLFDASEEDVLLSRKHCHAKNVSSLVFKNNNGRLSRCFLTWEGHELAQNVIGDKMPVGIHSHYYDLTITHVCGIVYNANYKAKSITKENKARQEVLNHIKYESGLNSGEPTVKNIGKKFLELEACRNMHGARLHLDANQLHTMQVFGMAAWVVEEGETKFDHVNLFSPYDAATIENFYKDFDEFYSKFRTKEDVIEHFLTWKKCFGIDNKLC